LVGYYGLVELRSVYKEGQGCLPRENPARQVTV
jgi:hypothetical protein